MQHNQVNVLPLGNTLDIWKGISTLGGGWCSTALKICSRLVCKKTRGIQMQGYKKNVFFTSKYEMTHL